MSTHNRLLVFGMGILFLVVSFYDVHRSIRSNEKPPSAEDMAVFRARIEEAKKSSLKATFEALDRASK